MISLRHNRIWLALALVAAMVFTTGASPAAALACVVQDLPAAAIRTSSQPVAEVCRAMGQPGPCCCGPEAGAARAGRSSEHSAGDELGRPGCGCSVEAPALPARPAVKPAVLVLSPGLAVLPAGLAAPDLPARVTPGFAPTTGSPRAPSISSGPSRAPPAC